MVQVNNTPITLRVKFSKVGALSYISHLDLVRTMMKTVVRARLPLYYTEGFNPKPKMTFAAPLSIGTESLVEFMDVRLTSRPPTDELFARLSENMPPEMSPELVYYPESKLSELAWLAYSIDIRTANADEELVSSIKGVLSSPEIEIEKRTKKGDITTVNIAPLIHSHSVSLDDGVVHLSATLSADSSSFLNPEHIIKVLRRECGVLSDPCLINESYSILRTAAYRADLLEFL
ncbi:MAG: DUF2344 domain-containing protein [Clostridia bacterium]|nr:DUF2344 domain-containing protein [Clostridia bacterium]